MLTSQIPTELIDWPDNAVRRASISNFGAGGANTHVIMEDPRYLISGRYVNRHTGSSEGSVTSSMDIESGYHSASERSVTLETTHTNGSQPAVNHNSAEDATAHAKHVSPVNDVKQAGSEVSESGHVEDASSTRNDTPLVFTLSARDEASVRTSALAIADYLDRGDSCPSLSNLAYTLNDKRTHLPWRLAVNASTVGELQHNLRSDSLRPSNSSGVPRLGFVFTGQGAQWYAMGRELINEYPVFREAIEEGGCFMRSLGAEWDPIGKIIPSQGLQR